MFDVFCTACNRRQLIFPSQVLGIVNDDSGIHVVFRCGCRETSIWHTGRRPAEAQVAAAA